MSSFEDGSALIEGAAGGAIVGAAIMTAITMAFMLATASHYDYSGNFPQDVKLAISEGRKLNEKEVTLLKKDAIDQACGRYVDSIYTDVDIYNEYTGREKREAYIACTGVPWPGISPGG